MLMNINGVTFYCGKPAGSCLFATNDYTDIFCWFKQCFGGGDLCVFLCKALYD